MSDTLPTLHLLCGKIASGKSKLGGELSSLANTVLISEDDWLSALYREEMSSISDYIRCSEKLRTIVGPHVAELLNAGVSVALDFQANTVEARTWMRGVLEQANAIDKLHVLDVSDEICIARMHARNERGEHPFAVTEDQFNRLSNHFVWPTSDEGFDIVVHQTDRLFGRSVV